MGQSVNKNVNLHWIAIAVSLLWQSRRAPPIHGRKRVMTQWAGRASRPRIMAAGTKSGVAAKAKPEDNISLLSFLRSASRLRDKDNLGDEVTISAIKWIYYDEVVDNLTGANSAQSARRAGSISGAPRATADELEYLNGKTAAPMPAPGWQ